MRATVQPNENQLRPLASAILTTTAAAALVFLLGVLNRSHSEEPSSSDWLKVDENGEPEEVTLADGTVLKLETYGDEYEAYDYRPPMKADKGQVLIDYNRMGRDGVQGGGIQLDLKHKKMYWGEWPFSTRAGSSIRRANLDGSHMETVVDRHPMRPSALTLDPEGGKIYWVNAGTHNGEGRSIECANLNGSHPRTIVEHLVQPGGIAVDHSSKKLYYFNDNDLIASALDGSDEKRLSVQVLRGQLLVDPSSQVIYWASGHNLIRRCRMDGAEVTDVVNLGEGVGKIRHIAIDGEDNKIYWTHESADGYIGRANLDGSQIEVVIRGIEIPMGLAIDVERRFVYWAESSPGVKGSGNVRILRAKLPSPLKSTRKPAPPFVTTVEPLKYGPGDVLALTGNYVRDTSDVLFLDDGTGEHAKARFTVTSDRELSVIAPSLSKRSRHPMIVIQSPGGITATFPRDVTVIHTGSSGGCDRFHDDAKFAYYAQPYSKIGGERAALFVSEGCVTGGGPGQGQNVLFLKNGSAAFLGNRPNNLLFYEPFAMLYKADKPAAGNRLVSVPAIRPSFVERLPEFSNGK